MKRTLIRHGFSLVLALGAGTGFALPQQHSSANFDIPAQPVREALARFAEQSGFQVAVYTDRVQGMRAPQMTGSYVPREAIAKLLAGTPLRAEFVDSHTI